MATEKDSTQNENLDAKNSVAFDKKHKKKATKIVLTISIILLLTSLVFYFLVRINSRPHPYRTIKQKAHYNVYNVVLEMFNGEFDVYPPSDALDPNGQPYCGAMKLAEAMMGQDLRGFHPDSVFRSDGTDGSRRVLYPDANDLTSELYQANIKIRKGPYLPIENADAYRLNEIYKNTGPFDGNNYVLRDVFGRVTNLKTGKRIGMPILYYKADTSKKSHDLNNPDNPDNIYNYKDNHTLLTLGVPDQPDKKHPLFEDPTIFYKMTKDYKSRKVSKPNRIDSFILISAGLDCLYGTKDDCVNFDMGWKPK